MAQPAQRFPREGMPANGWSARFLWSRLASEKTALSHTESRERNLFFNETTGVVSRCTRLKKPRLLRAEWKEGYIRSFPQPGTPISPFRQWGGARELREPSQVDSRTQRLSSDCDSTLRWEVLRHKFPRTALGSSAVQMVQRAKPAEVACTGPHDSLGRMDQQVADPVHA